MHAAQTPPTTATAHVRRASAAGSAEMTTPCWKTGSELSIAAAASAPITPAAAVRREPLRAREHGGRGRRDDGTAAELQPLHAAGGRVADRERGDREQRRCCRDDGECKHQTAARTRAAVGDRTDRNARGRRAAQPEEDVGARCTDERPRDRRRTTVDRHRNRPAADRAAAASRRRREPVVVPREGATVRDALPTCPCRDDPVGGRGRRRTVRLDRSAARSGSSAHRDSRARSPSGRVRRRRGANGRRRGR